mgnify:CR=1 FL=1
MGGAIGLDSRRDAFVELSKEMAMLLAAFKTGQRTLYVEHCPMAISDQGAFWISTEPEIRNPSYGQAMMSFSGDRVIDFKARSELLKLP